MIISRLLLPQPSERMHELKRAKFHRFARMGLRSIYFKLSSTKLIRSNCLNRSNKHDSFFFRSSHSHIRNTRQPRFSNNAVISRSCFILRSRFLFQYSWLSAGFVLRQSCPCQKQPSTNTAILRERKTKSG